MKHKLRVLGFWVWLAIGAGIAWLGQHNTIGIMSLITIIYGLVMAFIGFSMAITHAEERERLSNEARLRLQQEYNRAIVQQAIILRKAMLFLTNASMSRASGKMIAELLPQFNNEEQFDAAVIRAAAIVDAEMKELYDLIEPDKKDTETASH
jgi:hypothetical protein